MLLESAGRKVLQKRKESLINEPCNYKRFIKYFDASVFQFIRILSICHLNSLRVILLHKQY